MEIKYPTYESDRLVDENERFKLSALLDADSLFYGIYDAENLLYQSNVVNDSSKYSVLKEHVENHNINRVKLCCVSVPFVLVPSHEYSSSLGRDIIGHVANTVDNLVVRNDYCSRFDVRVVYALAGAMINDVQEISDQISLNHYITALLDNESGHDARQVQVSCVGDNIFFVVSDGDKLLFANRYKAATDYSRLYFIGLIYQQLNISKQSYPLVLSGLVSDALRSHLDKCFIMKQTRTLTDNSVVQDSVYYPLDVILKCA